MLAPPQVRRRHLMARSLRPAPTTAHWAFGGIRARRVGPGFGLGRWPLVFHGFGNLFGHFRVGLGGFVQALRDGAGLVMLAGLAQLDHLPDGRLDSVGLGCLTRVVATGRRTGAIRRLRGEWGNH